MKGFIFSFLVFVVLAFPIHGGRRISFNCMIDYKTKHKFIQNKDVRHIG